MPMHHWSQVDAGTFHAFHTAWITHLSEALNGGVLPSGYYALPEQHAGRFIADVLTLQTPMTAVPPAPTGEGGVAVAESQPRVRRKLSASSATRGRAALSRSAMSAATASSPWWGSSRRPTRIGGRTSRRSSTRRKSPCCTASTCCSWTCFRPVRTTPAGCTGLWERFDDEPYVLPPNEPLTLASYVAEPCPDAYVEHLAVGSPLAEMPLFLNPDRYIHTPLEATYMAAYRGLPAFMREGLEGRRRAPP